MVTVACHTWSSEGLSGEEKGCVLGEGEANTRTLNATTVLRNKKCLSFIHCLTEHLLVIFSLRLERQKGYDLCFYR